MKLSKIFSIGLVALTAIAVSTPKVSAHNGLKYTNIPFIIAAACPVNDPAVSSKLVSVNGRLSVVSVIDDDFNSGWEIYCSTPGTGSLPSPTAPEGTIPEGTLTFNISGLPSGGSVEGSAVYTDNPAEFVTLAPVVSGSTVTVPVNNPATTPGSPVIVIQIAPVTASGTATVTSSNIRYNNSPVLFDTTATDINNVGVDGTNITFCTP